MRLYSADEEERVRAQGMVREWTRSGLLDATQGAQLEAELRVELRRTNPFLRLGLALFTVLIVAASVALITTFVNPGDEVSTAVVAGTAALACIALAEYLVRRFRCYRFGVEEALAVAAVVLLGIAGAELTSRLGAGFRLPAVVALLVGAAGGYGLYRRFGYVYAALGGIACVVALPFQLDLSSASQRALAAAALAFVFALVRAKRLTYRDDYPGDEYGLLQAASWAGLYVALNLQLPGGWDEGRGWFYWCTYAATWVLPVTGLYLGIRERDRELMDVSLVLALVTLLTNKPYLGWPRHPWDPIVLGVLLIAIAVAVRRWLATGKGGERQGFTAARLLDKDRALVSLVTTASVVVPPGVVPSQAEPVPSEFDGGRSGGAGGGASW